jgi:DNA-directed RNA polymerase specialized sigma24 family protein
MEESPVCSHSPFTTWLFGMIRRTAADERRRHVLRFTRHAPLREGRGFKSRPRYSIDCTRFGDDAVLERRVAHERGAEHWAADLVVARPVTTA